MTAKLEHAKYFWVKTFTSRGIHNTVFSQQQKETLHGCKVL